VPRSWCSKPRNGENGNVKDTIVGVDLAKRVLQINGATATGHVTFRRRLTCAVSAVAQDDLYQMLAYPSKFSLPDEPTRLVILYPTTLDLPGNVVANCQIAQTSMPFQVATYDATWPDPCGTLPRHLMAPASALLSSADSESASRAGSHVLETR